MSDESFLEALELSWGTYPALGFMSQTWALVIHK